MRKPSRLLAFILAFSMAYGFTAPTQGWAMLIPNDQVDTSAAFDRQSDMKVIQKTLESKILRQKLHEQGLSDAEIDGRLTKLSDVQVHALAKNIQVLHPAGDPGGALIFVLVVAILILLVVYLIKRV